MIRVRSVSKSFNGRRGTVEALRGIELDVGDGEFVAVLGRSGCGKSTLLRVIAGLLPASSGEVRIADEPVREPRRDVAILFQRPALLPWRSVLDNVLLPIQVHGFYHAPNTGNPRGGCCPPSGWTPPSTNACRTSCPAACSNAWRSAAH